MNEKKTIDPFIGELLSNSGLELSTPGFNDLVLARMAAVAKRRRRIKQALRYGLVFLALDAAGTLLYFLPQPLRGIAPRVNGVVEELLEIARYTGNWLLKNAWLPVFLFLLLAGKAMTSKRSVAR